MTDNASIDAADTKPTPDRPGYWVDARFLPVPLTVSAEAQAALAAPSPFIRSEEPDPADKEAWITSLEEREKLLAPMFEQRAAHSMPKRQQEHHLSHSTLYEVEPTTATADKTASALFYVHGGGFTSGGGIVSAIVAYEIAKKSGLTTYSIDYRMPPRFPFPAGLDDTVEAYQFVIDRYGAANVVVYGASAGAAMIASCLLKARDLGMAMPAACVLQSPEADLTESGDSFETNEGVDPVLTRLTRSIALYADGHDLTDPYLSPLYGDFSKSWPPTMLTAGTRDLFLSNTVLMHRAIRRGGAEADLTIWEAMGHAGFYGTAPEEAELLEEQVQFMLARLPGGQGDT